MVQITKTATELKEFMSARSNHITLITGLPGSGKNYLCSVLIRDRLTSLGDSELDSSENLEMIVDLDRFGYHEKTADGRERWLVDVDQIPMRTGLIIVGTSDNYDEVLAKVASFRQSTGTPVVLIYSIPSFQVFTQSNFAKAKQAREDKNPFADDFQRMAELDREATVGQIQRKLGLLALAITTVFAPQLFSELDSLEAAEEHFAMLARKLFGPLDRYESLVRMMSWVSQLSLISKLSLVAHLNDKAGDQMITRGWHEDEVAWRHEILPVHAPGVSKKGGSHE